MSNGPYGQIDCRCGTVSLLVCGSPLGVGLNAGGEPVTFWPLVAIQIGQGADALDVSPDGRGGAAWECRQCGECLLHGHDEADVAVLEGDQEDAGDPTSALTPSQQGPLEALGYRVEEVRQGRR